MLATPSLVLPLIREALDDDTFEVSHTTATDADIGHRHQRILQNGTSDVPLAHHVVSEVQNRAVTIIERDADVDTAAKSLVAARFGLKGKSPYAPDVILVNEWVKKDFLGAVSKHSVAFAAAAGGETRPTRSASSALVKEILKDGSGSVLSTSSSGAVVEVEDRYARSFTARVFLMLTLGQALGTSPS